MLNAHRALAQTLVAMLLALLLTGSQFAAAAPSGGEGGAAAVATAAGATGEGDGAGAAAAAEYGFKGVELGAFRIRGYYPVEARKSQVTFKVYANVANEEVAEFKQLLKHRRQKVRDQIIVATRLAPLSDYDEAELTLFRRRILLRLERTLPELAIHEIYFSDFELTVETIAR